MSTIDDGDYGEAPPAAIGDNKPPATYADELREEHASLFTRLTALELDRAKLPIAVDSDAHLATVGTFVKNARELVKDAKAAHRKGSEDIKAKAKTWDAVFLTGGLCGAVAKLQEVAQALADDYTERKEAARREAIRRETERLRELAGEQQYQAQAYAEAGAHTAAEVVESQAEHTAKAADRAEAKADGKTADVVRVNHGNVTTSGRQVAAYELEDLATLDLNLLKGVFLEHELAQIFQRYADRMKGDPARSLPGLRIFQRTISTFR